MTNNTVRRIACLVTVLAVGVASSLSVPLARAAVAGTSVTVSAASAPAAPATGAAFAARQTGRGWGAMFACAGCLVAGGLVVAGGPASILIAVNTPGSAVALLACAGSCYEALAS